MVHLSANIRTDDEWQEYCDQFLRDRGMTHVANDYNKFASFGPIQTNACHDLFALPLARPLFLIVNCVSNSPSHPLHSLLLVHVGGTNWPTAVVDWRSKIDSIQAPPPRLTGVQWNSNGVEFRFPGQRARTNQVQYSSNLIDWTVVANFSGTNGPVVFRDPNTPSSSRRFYRLRRP